jgi:hypothetical protein
LAQHIDKKWGVENTAALREVASKKCERRHFEAFNMTDESFVVFKMSVEHSDLPTTEKSDLIIQLFEKHCPKTCKRFKDLSTGNLSFL